MSQPARRFRTAADVSATLLLEDGVSRKVVAERLGDRGDTVFKLYGDVTPRGRALAVASVGNVRVGRTASSPWDSEATVPGIAFTVAAVVQGGRGPALFRRPTPMRAYRQVYTHCSGPPAVAPGQAARREYSLISPFTRAQRITGPLTTAGSAVGARGGRSSRLRWGRNPL